MNQKKITTLFLCVLLGTYLSGNCQNKPANIGIKHTCFEPGKLWTDTKGNPIESHLGGVFYDNGTYYWYGANYNGMTIPKGSFQNQIVTWFFNKGISIYSSNDLYNWKLENIVLNETSLEPQNLLQPLNLFGRPNIIKNEATGKYILMAALLSADFETVNDVIYAVSDSPVGPFKFKGKLPWKNKPNISDNWDSEKRTGKKDRPERIRGWDMKLFKDKDQKAYLLVGHSATYIYELSDDYQSVVKGALMKGTEGEAPAMVNYNNTYYIFESRLTGYKANCNTYFVSDNIWGPWKHKGKFAYGPNEETTFKSQVTHVFQVEGSPGKFIFMSDRWNEISDSEVPNLHEMKHVWLPMEIDNKNKTVIVRWKDQWTLNKSE